MALTAPIPPFIYKKKSQRLMIFFVPLFCLAFIFLYQPQDLRNTDFLTHLKLPLTRETTWHLLIILLVLIGMAILTISRSWMTRYARKRMLTYRMYILWVLLEIVIMSFVFTISKSSITGEDVFSIFRKVLFTVVITLLIPYLMCYIYIIWQEKAHQVATLRERLEEDDQSLQKAYIQIYDEKGEMRLSIRRDNLILIESADNYIRVWYFLNSQESIKKVMIRNNLKNLANQLQNSRIVRCHRSYMVNLSHIKVMHREKEGVFIEFGIPGVPDIPISKTYADSISRWLISA